jgi:hypothetical protein
MLSHVQSIRRNDWSSSRAHCLFGPMRVRDTNWIHTLHTTTRSNVAAHSRGRQRQMPANKAGVSCCRPQTIHLQTQIKSDWNGEFVRAPPSTRPPDWAATRTVNVQSGGRRWRQSVSVVGPYLGLLRTQDRPVPAPPRSALELKGSGSIRVRSRSDHYPANRRTPFCYAVPC